MKITFFNRLFFRQAKNAFLIGLFVGLISSAIQVSRAFIEEQKRTDADIIQMIGMLREPMAQAAYSLDKAYAERIVKGLSGYRLISSIRFQDDYNSDLASWSRPASDETGKPFITNIFPQKTQYTEKLLHGRDKEFVGTLTIELDKFAIEKSFADRLGVFIFGILIYNIIFACVFALLFYYSLTRPLGLIVKGLLAVDFNNPDKGKLKIPVKHKKDELGSLVFTINQLLEGFGDSLQRRRAADVELSQYQKELESLVKERTAQLEVVNKQIIERKKVEAALADEKERLAVTLRSIGDAVIAADMNGQITMMNLIAEDLTGWVQKEAYGKKLDKVLNVIDEKTRDPCESPLAKVLETQTSSFSRDVMLISKQGKEKIIIENVSAIRDKTANIIGIILVFRDITEKRHMEQESLKAQKLESLGLLAGGIAHDFNNILTAILNNIIFAKMSFDTKEDPSDVLDEARRATLQAKNLTHQLLTFARGGVPIKKIEPIPVLIKDAAVFALRGSNCRCEFFIQDNLWLAEIDVGQINQVIQNLVINADQAMSDGGTISISAENITLKEGSKLPLEKGSYVKITVKDVGIGIPPEKLSKIFDPYFTTKQKGSGLGLTTTYSIIKKHGGYLLVESELGKGTTFYIHLPALADLKPTLANDKEDGLIRGQGKILIMDDQEGIVRILEKMITTLGYEVVSAADGARAVELYKSAKDAGVPFSVVILDLTVRGGMGGKDVLSQLLNIDARVKAIVSSGYSNDPIVGNYKEYGFKGVMAKPYDITELGKILAELIKGP